MNKKKINNYLLGIIVFVTFLGFYDFLILAINSGMPGMTRLITIPLRLLIGISCIVLLSFNIRRRTPYIGLFAFFVLVYIARLFSDIISDEFFYISYLNFFFYFVSFAVIPFVAIVKVDFGLINMKRLFNVFLISGFIFSIISLFVYSKFIGSVNRLSSSSAGEDVISPLILSYCSTLIIGVLVFYMMFNKTSFIQKVFIYISISLSTVPFFLGSSRGSIFALFFPFVMMFVSSFSTKNIFRMIVISFISLFVLVYLDGYMESGLVERFMTTQDDIDSGSSSASRLYIWSKSFSQFIENPVFGDKLNTTDIDQYPHNIFLEILQQTGIIGFIPFVILVLIALNSCMKIFKLYPEYSWIVILFMQALMQNMFSGAMYTAAWFWTAMALVLSLNFYLKNKCVNL